MARRAVPVSTLLGLCASAVLQLACAIHHGTFAATAVLLVAAAAVLIGAALHATSEVDARWLLAPVLGVVAAGIFAAEPLPGLADETPLVAALPLGAGALALTYLVALPRRAEQVRFAVLAVLAFALGAAVFRASPHPHIDVFALQTQGADDLLAGHDPYATVSVPDTHTAGLHVPYTYPPVQLIVTTLARAVTGDVRFAMLAALLLAAVCARQAIRRAGGEVLAQDATLLIVFAGPLTAFVLDQAWVDCVPLAGIAAGLWAHASGRSRLSAVLFGLAFAAKQPLIVGFPLLLLLPRFGRRELAVAVAVAAAITLPFFAWDPGAFWASTVRYFVDLPARSDALTVTNLFRVRFDFAPGQIVGAVAAAAAAAYAWKRLPRTATTFVLLLGLVLVLVFATGKLAFANYYFMVSGLVCMTPPSRPATNSSASGVSGAQPPARL